MGGECTQKVREPALGNWMGFGRPIWILSNHFHLLVEVPDRRAQPLSAEEVLARIETLSSSALTPGRFRQHLDQFRAAGGAAGKRAFLDRICAATWDISGYLQRPQQWFNRRQGRRGVLWEEHFKSVLVEGTGDPLSTMAACFDLNPVRAGLVKDPKVYRWRGCGAAAAGDRPAREASPGSWNGFPNHCPVPIAPMDIPQWEPGSLMLPVGALCALCGSSFPGFWVNEAVIPDFKSTSSFCQRF